MKSAYELAMERLQKDSPTQILTEEQRKEIAEIDSLYRARIAERELLLKEQIQKETAAGKFAEVEQLHLHNSNPLFSCTIADLMQDSRSLEWENQRRSRFLLEPLSS